MKRAIRTARCELDGEFTGFHVVVRTNPPMRVYEEMASGDFTRILVALATMTIGSNLTDDNDQPVDLSTVEGWREMPADLMQQVALKINEALASPKASLNGSGTPSESAAVLSPVSIVK